MISLDPIRRWFSAECEKIWPVFKRRTHTKAHPIKTGLSAFVVYNTFPLRLWWIVFSGRKTVSKFFIKFVLLIFYLVDMWCIARFGTIWSLELYENQHSSMGVFHVFKIVQMVPNRATHHRYCLNLFLANAHNLYLLRISEDHWFSAVLRWYKMGTSARNGWMLCLRNCKEAW